MQMTFPCFRSGLVETSSVETGLSANSMQWQNPFFQLISPSLYYPIEEQGVNSVSEPPNVLSLSPFYYRGNNIWSFGFLRRVTNQRLPSMTQLLASRNRYNQAILLREFLDFVTEVPNKKRK